MTANLRTVRLLDREPGKPTETRTVSGIVLERGVAIPPSKAGPMDALKAMEVGESFVWPRRIDLRDVRRRLPGREFTSRAAGPRQFRVWRTK